MATILRDGDLTLLDGTVAVVGYGSQGHAHALNLHDSGVRVVVGLREGSSSWADAEEAGLEVRTIPDAVRGAQLVSLLLPDQFQPQVFSEHVEPNLAPDATVLFDHGFNVVYGRIAPAAGHDVVMVAPKGPGHVVRRLFTEGLGTPALIAVEQGRADDTEEAIRHRQDVYTQQTAPIIEVYRERGLLVEVDGIGSVDEVAARIREALAARGIGDARDTAAA